VFLSCRNDTLDIPAGLHSHFRGAGRPIRQLSCYGKGGLDISSAYYGQRAPNRGR